jgi:hypothetical protein
MQAALAETCDTAATVFFVSNRQTLADSGKPAGAVSELVAIIVALLGENRALAKAASPGYVRGLLRR